jgi:hypothetical protein
MRSAIPQILEVAISKMEEFIVLREKEKRDRKKKINSQDLM